MGLSVVAAAPDMTQSQQQQSDTNSGLPFLAQQSQSQDRPLLPPVDVVIVGCGLPQRGMGWYHLMQFLQMTGQESGMSSDANYKNVRVVGIVEPFFMQDLDSAPEAFRSFKTELERKFGYSSAANNNNNNDDDNMISITTTTTKPPLFYRAVSELPDYSQRTALAVVSCRAADNPFQVRECIQKGIKFVYLEKPGARSSRELIDLQAFAQQRGVEVFMGFVGEGVVVSCYVTTTTINDDY